MATDARKNIGRAKSVSAQGQSYVLGRGAASGLPRGAPFTVLGIETSCDDTGAAVMRSDGTILGEALASQYEIHEAFGGVVPGLARDAHEKNIQGVIAEALKEAGMTIQEVDAVAVTVGPGLEICLRVGASAARALAAAHGKPFVAVHHLEAHCLLARPLLKDKAEGAAAAAAAGTSAVTKAEHAFVSCAVSFPFLALLVSGGHCQLLLVKGVGCYEVLGGTLDDALGEAYDKAARMLGIKGGAALGPALEKLAREGDDRAVALPVPMARRKDCDFSYAGLKNAFRLAVQKAIDAHLPPLAAEQPADPADPHVGEQQQGEQQGKQQEGELKPRYLPRPANAGNVEERAGLLPSRVRADLAASFQRVAIAHLTDRLHRALDWCQEAAEGAEAEAAEGLDGEAGRAAGPGAAGGGGGFVVSSLAVVGGVAANQAVRAALEGVCSERGIKLVAPPPRLCTDNGVMVAWAGIEKLLLGVSDPIEVEGEEEDAGGAAAQRAPELTGGQQSGQAGGQAGGEAGGPRRRKKSKDVRPRWPLGSEFQR